MLTKPVVARPVTWDRWGSEADFAGELQTVVPYAAIAEAVIELRVRSGLSQEQLADRVGTTQSVVSRLESGTHEVRVGILNRIADAFGMRWRPVFQDVAAANASSRTVPRWRRASVTYDHRAARAQVVGGGPGAGNRGVPSLVRVTLLPPLGAPTRDLTGRKTVTKRPIATLPRAS